ncbi:MAG: protein-L-isoaspartate(D-aspartate) O-methyltransferase [Archangium sp.]|nr:protein-L-isoaspartate(D-aspartate) O-methyltransferase [Archangium sp.]
MNELVITDPRVLEAMAAVPRAAFLRPNQRALAQEDRPLDIGEGQTTSQPSLIAWTLEQLDLKPGSRVLEVGTGCGYQTALLARLASEVFSVDIIENLVVGAAENLGQLGITNVHLRADDGYLGWPEAAPFDAIVVAAGAPSLPPPLVEQLAPGGRLIIPVGERDDMSLLLVNKLPTGEVLRQKSLSVRFVPLTGPHTEAHNAKSRPSLIPG